MSITVRKRKRAGKTYTFYQAEVVIEGKRKTKSFSNRAEAEEWECQHKNFGTFNFLSPVLKEDYLLEDLVREYRQREEPVKRLSSVEADDCRWTYFLDSPLAQCPVLKINDMAIDYWFEWLHAHPTVKGYRRITFEYELAMFKTLLNWYRNNKDYAYRIPFVERHKKRTRIPGKVSFRGKTSEFFMTAGQVLDWFEALAKIKNPVYLNLAHLMVGTGFRIGEACGLRWKDNIDFEKKTIVIDRSLSWHKKTKRPYLQDLGVAKNQQSLRTIAMPDGLRPMLLEMKVKSKNRYFVFERDSGEALHYSTLHKAFTGAFEKAKIEFSGTHICRHTFATLALKVTGNIALVQNILGHTSDKQARHYAKISVLNGNDTPSQVYDIL